MYNSFLSNFAIALEAMSTNKLRAVLTSLGIIFGVASVIAMLAIGRGAQQKILEKMKLLGANNIIIQALSDEKMQSQQEKETTGTGENSQVETPKKKRFSPGLSIADAISIMNNVPNVDYVTPEIIMETYAIHKGFRQKIKLVGVSSSFFKIKDFELIAGRFFTETYDRLNEPVCVIGSSVKSRLFSSEEAIGKQIKCGNQWLKVIGVMKDSRISEDNIKSLGVRDVNLDVYIPASSMLIRYINRGLITQRDIKAPNMFSSQEETNTNQLDKLTVTLTSTKYMMPTAEVISRLLFRRHNKALDYEIIVPELLLQQEKQTREIFNMVLGTIASISLIVGGIGIMNIMLASVMERTKEIGIRLAIGAKKKDVLMQFLSEAVAISLTGGLIGIALGIAASYVIESITEIPTIVTWYSIAISFFVSITIGIIFGIMPAKRAAEQNPIESLRYE